MMYFHVVPGLSGQAVADVDSMPRDAIPTSVSASVKRPIFHFPPLNQIAFVLSLLIQAGSALFSFFLYGPALAACSENAPLFNMRKSCSEQVSVMQST